MSYNRGVPVRFGNTVLHAQSVEQAVVLAQRLNASRLPNTSTPHLFEQLGPAANQILGLLSSQFHLTGKATKSLGTALRARAVRQQVDDSLLQELSYISDGADAVRHLTSTSVQRAVRALVAGVPKKSVMCEKGAAPPANHEDDKDDSPDMSVLIEKSVGPEARVMPDPAIDGHPAPCHDAGVVCGEDPLLAVDPWSTSRRLATKSQDHFAAAIPSAVAWASWRPSSVRWADDNEKPPVKGDFSPGDSMDEAREECEIEIDCSDAFGMLAGMADTCPPASGGRLLGADLTDTWEGLSLAQSCESTRRHAAQLVYVAKVMISLGLAEAERR